MKSLKKLQWILSETNKASLDQFKARLTKSKNNPIGLNISQMKSLNYHERQLWHVGVHLRSISEIPEGKLDNVTHLVPSSGENSRCVVGDNSNISKPKKIKVETL